MEEQSAVSPESKASENPKSENSLLELVGERIVTFKDRAWPITFYLERITQADWERCFNGVVYEQIRHKDEQIIVLDQNTSALELFESKLLRADGFVADFTSRPGWRSRILPRHGLKAIQILRAAAASTSDGPADPDLSEVRLDVIWGMQRPGTATLFKGLVHRFHSPSAEHRRKLYRAVAQARLVNGKTVFSPRQRVLLGLYDELIAGVEGYAASGQPLSSPEQIRAEMDGYHKVVAVEHLFAGSEEADGNSEAEE